ncbi:MAG TPA: hypothetical protein VK631_27340 [Solirubrobacteraceae bacterium]|nr:hypothetical protein [Solirubrobacteraceae bacterium]
MTRKFAVAAGVAAAAALALTAPSAQAATCDPIGGGTCLLPFPNDYFTKKDPSTPTGRRLALKRSAMPANKDGVRIDPRAWNRADGFSPGQQITARIPGLDSRRAFERSGIVPITDIAQSLADRQPVVLIDARTGKRQPIWAELDSSAPSNAQRALLIRPAKNLLEGRRYVVALRRLKTSSGKPIRPTFAFRALRDRLPTRSTAIRARRPAMQKVFRTLDRAGIARGDLVLAWDFTVASRQSTTGPMLHMRDEAFKALGDANLADLKPEGRSPAFAITRDEATPPSETEIGRIVEGTVSVPCFLENDGCAIGKGFHRGADGLPAQKPGNTYAAFFRCVVPRDVPAGGGRALLYGHGLLGSPLDSSDSAQAELETLAHQQGFTVCGTYWSGLSAANGNEDTGQAAAAIQDLSKFGAIADRLQQGMLNSLFLGRAMVAADGLRTHAAFAGAFDGTGRLFYDGNSQGGIEGGALTAVAPDFDRAVLGVPGMNYSTLLQRSVDFAPFRSLLDVAYTKPLDRALIYSLLTNLWDRGESDGYARYMTTRPLPNTPPHEVLLHVALGDHQVAPVTADGMARTIGARVWDKLDPGRSTDDEPFFGIPALTTFPYNGSALIVFDSGPVTPANPQGTPLAPTGNVPPPEGQDPHEFPRRTQEARTMKDQFLRVGGRLQTPPCGGAVCRSNGWTGP